MADQDKNKKDQDKEKKDGAKPQKAPSQKRRMPFSVRFAIFMLFVTSLVFLAWTVVFLVCMIPTFVALIVDRHPQKTAWITVGTMNLAGMVPIWFTLADMGHSVQAALQLISQPMTIMISYGGAMIGWVIYNNVTPFIAAIVVRKNENRLKDIDSRQKELLKKWGKEVILN